MLLLSELRQHLWAKNSAGSEGNLKIGMQQNVAQSDNKNTLAEEHFVEGSPKEMPNEVIFIQINKVAKAGTLESNDILIMVMPNDSGRIELELESIVMQQFGDVIQQVILHKVKEMGIESITIKAQDKGALDYTIGARVETAITRAL